MYNVRIPIKSQDYAEIQLNEGQLLELISQYNHMNFLINQNFYFIEESTFNHEKSTEMYSKEVVLGIAIWDGEKLEFINHEVKLFGKVTLNPEQSLVYHYQTEKPEMLCLAVTGKAGTGKTFVLTAGGLHKQSKSRKGYDGIAYSKEIIAMGKDPGALPGEIHDKTKEHYAPITENIRTLCNIQEKFDESEYRSMVEFFHVAYGRGRNVVDKAVWIIDEFQNFNKQLAKSMLTRAGYNTLVGICGSPLQVDDRKLSETNNGLVYTINQFADKPWFTHIELVRSERKGLSMHADDLL